MGDIAVDPQDAAGIVRTEPPVLEGRIPEAEGEDRPDARLLKPADRCVRMVRRVHDVGPIDERGDARVRAFERTPQVAGVYVVGPVVRRELVEDAAEVRTEGVIRGAGPDRRLPGVPMRVDEARDDDVAGGIDGPGSVGGQVAADLGDPVILDEDVGAGHLTELRVLGEDVSALDEGSLGHRWSPLVSARRWVATAEKSASSPTDRSAARITSRLIGGLWHGSTRGHGELLNEAQVLRGEGQRERNGRRVGVEERVTLVPDHGAPAALAARTS